MKKAEIAAEVHKYPCYNFYKHNELLALAVSSEMFCDEDVDFQELVFAVEKEWLVNYMNRPRVQYDGESVKKWLQSEYTSEDSYLIFETALTENAIMMIDFD